MKIEIEFHSVYDHPFEGGKHKCYFTGTLQLERRYTVKLVEDYDGKIKVIKQALITTCEISDWVNDQL